MHCKMVTELSAVLGIFIAVFPDSNHDNIISLFAGYSVSNMIRYNEDHSRAPSFLMEPPIRVEFSNMSGTWIDCTADGHPTPRIEWTTTDGSPAVDIPGIRFILRNGTLVFPAFLAAEYRQDVHSAIYRCLVSNTVGSIISRDVQVRGGEFLMFKFQ